MKKKTKFGKRITIYLSNEAISEIDKLTSNRSGYIENIILHGKNKKEELENKEL